MFSRLFTKGSPQAATDNDELLELKGQVAALDKSQAVIEFTPQGEILRANSNFLQAVGYTLDEIRGRHHSIFVTPDYRQSSDYQRFWEKLGRGEYDTGQYKRIGKGGREIWIQASYNPILRPDGSLIKVIKYATDITADKTRNADFEGQLAAINKAQAVIQFSLDGTILEANDNFCQALGYALHEIRGQHHRMFVDPVEHATPAYREFWEKLRSGQYDAGKYRRIGKGGREIWIQASYNPILDASGRPAKVVKYASDITEQVRAARILEEAVAETQGVVDAAQAGDLTRRIPIEGKRDQIRLLCAGVNTLVDTMAELVSQVRTSADTVSLAAKEIAKGNLDLSSRTEEQASNVEETASTMEELTTTVRHNTDNAVQANSLAERAREVAEQGGELVGKVVGTMSSIQEASDKIADIIGVIDGIAFQTNILALNAAVEAARAGEQGRGFAVVATEVRSLAQRSATAAKEIKTLISDSSSRVDAGTQLVSQAGRTMDELVLAVKKVASIMAGISGASQEQSSGIQQVGDAIHQMDQITQQNAALVEEAAAAAESLEEQAEQLVRAVSHFTLEAGAGNPHASNQGGSKISAPTRRPPPARTKPLPAREGARKPTLLPSPDNEEWAEF